MRLTRHRVLFAALTVVLCGTGRDARADRRIFGFTYPYMTQPKGGFEIEYYLDAEIDRVDDPATVDVLENGFRPKWRHQMEFEYGITDKWDFGFYNVFEQQPYGAFEYRGVKLRSRYRFLEEGQWVIDPAVYLEVALFGDEIEIEQRLIVGRRFGRLELDLNIKVEEELEFKSAQFKDGRLEPAETELEIVFNPTLGVGWHFNEHVAVGLEYYGHLEVEHGEVEHFANFVGPTLSVAGGRFWWTVTVQPQLGSTHDHAAVHVRSLFAIVL